jgi:cytochrome c oxidase assembly protein subunit 11
VAIITGMLGLTYFAVPLYRIFCAATGYGGTVSEGNTVESKLRKRIEDPDVATEECDPSRLHAVPPRASRSTCRAALIRWYQCRRSTGHNATCYPPVLQQCSRCRAAAKRQVTVTFASEVQPGLKWSFKPCQKSVKVRPGQSTLAFYTAENLSDEHLTGVSTYNVAPPQVRTPLSLRGLHC